MPTRIDWGEGSVLHAGRSLRALGKRCLIVSGGHSADLCGAADDVIRSLDRAGVAWTGYRGVCANPDTDCIDAGAGQGDAFGADFVIGIGGGSPMDAAKAIAVLLANPGTSAEGLFALGSLDAFPVACVPTTAGTGSEVTPYAILTRKRDGIKGSLPQRIWPELALVDPRYYHTMTQHVLTATGLDTLAHLLESGLSTKGGCLSDAMVEMGLLRLS